MPADQLAAWKRDRAGCIADTDLARKHNWRIGDHIHIEGDIFPANLDLTLRGIYTIDPPQSNLYFNAKYLEESVGWFKDSAGFYFTRVDTPEDMPKVAHAIDGLFHGSPVPTKSESEQAFKLDFVAFLGNVKAFILSICGAVVFTTLLVCANTMAMSVRERTREVAVLRTLGFTQGSILRLLFSESIAIAADRRRRRHPSRHPRHPCSVPPRHGHAGFHAHDPRDGWCSHAGRRFRRTGKRSDPFLPSLTPRHSRRPALPGLARVSLWCHFCILTSDF